MRNHLKSRQNEDKTIVGVSTLGTNDSFILPKMANEAEIASKNPPLFAQIVIGKLQKVIEAREDDSILSEHIERVMKTPTSKPVMALAAVKDEKKSSLKILQKRSKIAFSTLTQKCEDVDRKVII